MGNSTLVRYADDCVMAFEALEDAKRVAALGKRLERYGLKLHPDKTRLIDFRPPRAGRDHDPDTDGSSFDFLGFTHVWGKSLKGAAVVRQVTAKGRFARALAAVKDWCRNNRHRKMKEQHDHLSLMMRGHYAYYGISGNGRRISWFAYQVARTWRKWLLRRHRGGRLTWSRFSAYLKQHPLPPPKIVHKYVKAVSETLPRGTGKPEIGTSGSVRGAAG
jgi:RNA-directed DNA polymerase